MDKIPDGMEVVAKVAPLSKKYEAAKQTFTKLMQYRIILKNHNVIANSTIPKHKQKKHDQLVTEWIVKVRNVESKLDSQYNKLNDEEKLLLTRYGREVTHGS